MQHYVDQKEQSRQNNDVGVHRDVPIERHFSDTIWRLFARSLRKDNVNQSEVSQLIGAVSRSEDPVSSATHGDGLEYPRSNTPLCANLADSIVAPGVHPALLTTKSSTPAPILSVFSPISTTALAGVRKSRPINKGRCFEGTTLKTIRPFLPATKMGAVTLIEETSVPPSPNLYLSASRFSSISCFRPRVFQQTLVICPPV